MSERSYAQIRWQQNRLGLLMTNVCRQRFFIYAEKVSALFNDPGPYKEIKHRDRKPSGAIGYYAGQVLGALSTQGDDHLITLIIGDPLQNIDYDPKSNKAPKDYLTSMTFLFPKTELRLFHDTMMTMRSQEQEFATYLLAAEATPLEIKRKRTVIE